MLTRTCEICGEDISHTRKNRKICEKRSCYNAKERLGYLKRRKLKPVEAICDVCGKEFIKKVGNQKRCSPDCKLVAKNNLMPSLPPVKATHKQPIFDFDPTPRADDFSQKVYDREQRQKNNWFGRYCLEDGCNNPVFGENNRYCEDCREKHDRAADIFRSDGNFLWESNTGELWVGGA